MLNALRTVLVSIASLADTEKYVPVEICVEPLEGYDCIILKRAVENEKVYGDPNAMPLFDLIEPASVIVYNVPVARYLIGEKERTSEYGNEISPSTAGTMPNAFRTLAVSRAVLK